MKILFSVDINMKHHLDGIFAANAFEAVKTGDCGVYFFYFQIPENDKREKDILIDFLGVYFCILFEFDALILYFQKTF